MCFFEKPLSLHSQKQKIDSIAQLVEHIPFKDGVLGSSPSWITKAEVLRFSSKPLFCSSEAFAIYKLYLLKIFS